MIRVLFLGLAFVLFTGCSKSYPPLPTVEKVDIQKYKGTWYEIARYDHYFEEGCKNVTATYIPRDDEYIDVINRCTMIEDNEKKEANGIAYATDESFSKLKVSFFRPFYGDYWILDLADDYSYALVGTPSHEYLWILSRTKKIDQKIKDTILSKLPELGFDRSKFIWTIQE
jgi:apolipoprotein D and lipocalin family protein